MKVVGSFRAFAMERNADLEKIIQDFVKVKKEKK